MGLVKIITRTKVTMKECLFKESHTATEDLLTQTETTTKGTSNSAGRMVSEFIKVVSQLTEVNLKTTKSTEEASRKVWIHFSKGYFNMIKKSRGYWNMPTPLMRELFKIILSTVKESWQMTEESIMETSKTVFSTATGNLAGKMGPFTEATSKMVLKKDRDNFLIQPTQALQGDYGKMGIWMATGSTSSPQE